MTASTAALPLCLEPREEPQWPPDKHTASGYEPLWLCVAFPSLALEAAGFGSRHSGACAVLDKSTARCLVHTVSPAARCAGVTPGMPLSQAYALCPALSVQARDLESEAERLRQLASWAAQFTSVVSLAPPQALLLEIRGSLRLFGGLQELQRRVDEKLEALGLDHLMAVAPTPPSSLLLASSGQRSVVTDRAALRSALGGLPVDRLPFDTARLQRLVKSGIRTLGELWRLPRQGLARRFGPDLLDYLDRALGVSPGPREAYRAPPVLTAELDLPAEVHETGLLSIAAQRLIAQLCHELRSRDAGTAQLHLELLHTRHSSSRFELGTRHSTRDENHLERLLEEHLSRLHLSAPVSGLRLTIATIHPFTAISAGLLAGQDLQQQERDWQRVLEQLQARLGREAVRTLRAQADHRPERAWGYGVAGEPLKPPPRTKRPLWLLPEPRPLSLRQSRPWWHGYLSVEAEPERIEGGWWDGQDSRRDYYVATDSHGSRLWIYRDLRANAWYLHGLFG